MTEEVVVEQTPEQIEAEENAAIAEGYKKVAGDEKDAPAKSVSENTPEPVPAKPALEAPAKVEPAPDPWKDVPPVVRQHLESISGMLPKFEQRLKSAEGVMGAIRAGQDAAKAAIKAGYDAPSDARIEAAGDDPEEWQQIRDDHPEWATGLDKRMDQRFAAQAAKLKAEYDAQRKQDLEADAPLLEKQRAEWVKEAEEYAYLRLKHPTYKTTINTPEFSAWRKAQAPEINALGASANADDAIRMLDLYAEHTTQQEKAALKAAKTQERLAAAVPVQGQGTGGPTTLSEDEQLEAGFRRVRPKDKR